MNLFYIILLFFILMVCPSPRLFAQADLPVNATGKICFCDTLVTDSVSSQRLAANLLQFIEQLPGYKASHNQPSKAVETIELKGLVFPVYIKRITQQINGKIIYDASFHISEGKVAYSFTNFLFNPYARNRYGKFVPESGKYKPLEEDFQGNNKTWEKHKKTVETQIKHQIERLEAYLTSP